MIRIMKIEKIKDLIQQARGAAKTEEFHQLVDHFEEFVDLFNERENHLGDIEHVKRMIAAQTRFWASFGKMAENFGLTPELMKQYFETPENFSPAEWQTIETIQKEVLSDEEPAPKKGKKMKRSKGKVRI